MTTLGERADALARWGAPPLVQAMAHWLHLDTDGHHADRAVGIWLAVADVATKNQPLPFVPLPEVERLLQLRRQVPPALQASAAAPAPASSTFVSRTYEATTPLLRGRGAFADAAKWADNPARWCDAAPQMQVVGAPVSLPADGCLWRARLKKATDLLQPIRGPLKTCETIEIQAHGRNTARGGGYRRYEHSLFSCELGEGLTELMEDSGWIELHGTAAEVHLRIHKRVTVRLPQDLEQHFGGILQVALSALLWFWADGFLRTVATPFEDPATKTPAPGAGVQMPPEKKQVVLQPDGQGGQKARVAVLGGGPAGLACAWLLSRPCNSAGQVAWDPPSGQGLSLEVSVLEKQARLGGKAASTRRNLPGDSRIEEHGLHVVMGCYENLLRLLGEVGALDALVPRWITRIPMGPDSGPEPGLDLELGRWPLRAGREPLADWLGQARAVPLDLNFLGGLDLRALWSQRPEVFVEGGSRTFEQDLRQLGFATQDPSPWLRAVVGIWSHLQSVHPLRESKRLDPAALRRSALHTLFDRMAGGAVLSLSRLEFGAAPGLPPEGLAAMARQMRLLARVALPADDLDPRVRLAGELVELATTVAIGLAEDGHFPGWSLNPGGPAPGSGYTVWARRIHELDELPLDAWLESHGAAKDFATGSRLLAAVTAGLFTTPSGIASGTFIHGLVRLLLTYEDAPYLMLRGGTDAAVVAPIARALGKAGVALHLNSSVTGVLRGSRGEVTAVQFDEAVAQQTTELAVDAVVLAIPPFQQALESMNLPADLTDGLRAIESTATLSIQHWTRQPPRFAQAIVSGLERPLRCAAAMSHLQGDEGKNVCFAPVYYCGDLDEADAKDWNDHLEERTATWLNTYAASFQGDAALPPSYSVVHAKGSARYVSASCDTQHARPEIDRTGVPNLWLAGDWTQSSLACGSIEAAVTSGLEAARLLLWELGCTVNFPINGAYYDKEAS